MTFSSHTQADGYKPDLETDPNGNDTARKPLKPNMEDFKDVFEAREYPTRQILIEINGEYQIVTEKELTQIEADAMEFDGFSGHRVVGYCDELGTPIPIDGREIIKSLNHLDRSRE